MTRFRKLFDLVLIERRMGILGMKFSKSGLASVLDTKLMRAFAVLATTAIVIFFAAIGPVRATVPFAPTITLETSTTQATAHPDARITVDNSGSTENLKNVTLNLPDGLWGSLAAATECDYAVAQAGNCTSASQIGTVKNYATILSGSDVANAVLRGAVFLTKPAPGDVATDPAAISVKVQARVGNVDLGDVIVPGRVLPRYASAPTGFQGALTGIQTRFANIPESITDTHGRTVTFHVDKLAVDLVSKQGVSNPLLTNPSKCSATQMTAQMQSWENPSTTYTPSPSSYTVTGCANTHISASAFSFVPTDSSAGSNTGLTSTITLDPDSASFGSFVLQAPPALSLNMPAFGIAADRCPPASFTSTLFNPSSCPSQAKIGTATITTPLLPNPVTGNVWVLDKSPTPWIGIDVNDSIAGNPKGINIRIIGQSSTPQADPACTDSCDILVQIVFVGIPQAPVSSMQITINETGRVSSAPGNPALSGKILSIATAGDSVCQKFNDFVGRFTSYATGNRYEVGTANFTGCSSNLFATNGAPLGAHTTSASPSLLFTAETASPLSCSVDSQPPGDSCAAPSYPTSALTAGIHRFFARAGSGMADRAFVVDPVTPANTAPATTITASPGTSSSTATPSFSFSSSETSDFQCAIAPGATIAAAGAFLPCGSSSTSGTYTVPTLQPLVAGFQYTFAVRAQDGSGVLDPTPDSVTFTVDIPFAPTFQADISTYAARQHPDLDVTVTNPSHEDIKDITFNLPDGFFGGLTGVASLCPLANADAGTCPASSQVGTVDAAADVDESTIRNSGTVYLTESRDPANEPASLSIKLHPAIQDVVFNDIIVNAHLKIRGVAQGIDAFALDLPHSATNALDGTTEFDLRKMVLKLRTGTGASYPLLTNPSDCRLMSYDASFTGYSASTASASQPFQATGCAGLPFAPALSITALDGDTGLPAGPSDAIKRKVLNLSANLTSTPDQAGIKNVVLTMPLPITIDPQKLPPSCTLDQQAAQACPESAAIGTVSAKTPLLNDALSGKVYLLKSDPATPSTKLPRLLIALRGRINVDIIATNSFVNGSQVVTKFSTLPDVPLTSFAINIHNPLTTTFNACDYGLSDWNITGTLTGFNGSASNVVIPQKFDCQEAYVPTASYVLKRKGAKSTLTAHVKAQIGKSLKKKLTLRLPKGLTFNKAGFTAKKLAKLVIVKVDGKPLKPKCFKKRSSSKFQLTFCGNSGSKISIAFKAGTLTASKKLAKTPVYKMTAIDSDNQLKPVTTVTG